MEFRQLGKVARRGKGAIDAKGMGKSWPTATLEPRAKRARYERTLEPEEPP